MADDGIYEWWKQNVPSDARAYLQTLFGDRKQPFTEKDFTKKELQQMESAILKSKPRLMDKAHVKQQQIEAALKWGDPLDTHVYSPELANNLAKELKNDDVYKKLINEKKNYSDENMNLFDVLQNKYKEKYGLEFDDFRKLIESKNPYNVPLLFEYKNSTAEPPPIGLNTPQQQIEKYKQNYALAASGTGNVQYQDYPKNGIPMADTLGRFQYKTDPSTGSRQIIDDYNFYNAKRADDVNRYEQMNPLEKAAAVIKKGFTGNDFIKDMAGEIGNAYIGKNGRPVDIKYDPNEIKNKKGGKIKSKSNVDKPIYGGSKTI